MVIYKKQYVCYNNVMSTQERLAGYSSDFSPEVIDAVSESADRQRQHSTYIEFLQSVGISESRQRPLVDIKPNDFDEKLALVMHLPMANPLDANQLYSIATVAEHYPNRRIIANANPSGIGYGYNTLNKCQRTAVAQGDFRPAVEGLVRYLDKEGIEKIDQVGESYGSELVAATRGFGAFDIGSMVMIEPASVKKRSVIELASDFKSSEKALDDYVKANNNPNLIQARKDSISNNNYAIGLGRLSNIATSRGLAKGKFKDNLEINLLEHDEAEVGIAWGSESELSVDSIVLGIVHGLSRKFGEDRVRGLRLEGQKHALANDRALQSAIIAHFIGRE